MAVAQYRCKPAPVAAPAVLAGVVCFALLITLRRAGADSPVYSSAAACRVCIRPADPAAAATVPPSPGGRDVVGQKMPRLDFERWVKAEVDEAPGRAAGRATLYRWWTDGCPHCEKTLPAVERLRQKYGPRGLRVVAVYHSKPPRDVSDKDILAAATAMGYGGAVALDQDWSELKKFYLDTGDRPATSASFLVGTDGVIRFVHPGPRFYPSDQPAEAREDADYRAIVKAVEALLGAG